MTISSYGGEKEEDGRRERDVRIICLRGRREKKPCEMKINDDDGAEGRGKQKGVLMVVRTWKSWYVTVNTEDSDTDGYGYKVNSSGLEQHSGGGEHWAPLFVRSTSQQLLLGAPIFIPTGALSIPRSRWGSAGR